MDGLIFLIPIALFLGLVGLGFFIWTIKDGQYDDLEGATYRALFEEDDIEEEQTLERNNNENTTNDAYDIQKPTHKSPT